MELKAWITNVVTFVGGHLVCAGPSLDPPHVGSGVLKMSTRYNNGSHYENHQQAAELHDAGAHAHRAGEQQGKGEHLTGHEHSREVLEHSNEAHQHTETATNRHGIAWTDTLTSRPWLTNCGRPEDVHTDRPQRIGSMPNNCGRALKDEAKTLSHRSAHRSDRCKHKKQGDPETPVMMRALPIRKRVLTNHVNS